VFLRNYPAECGEFCNHPSCDPVISVKGFIVMEFPIVSNPVRGWLGLLWLGCALFTSACAHDEDVAKDSSPHHGRHGGGGRYGQGQGGMFDQSNPYDSPSLVPGQ
jgi:hypothetical protein